MQEYWAYDFENEKIKELKPAVPAKETNVYPIFASPSTGLFVDVDILNNVMVFKQDRWQFVYPEDPEHQIYLDEFKQLGLVPFM